MTDRVAPLFELVRGNVVESMHYGAVAVADARGNLLYSLGDPHTVAFLRSSAKPFQALPFFEHGAHEALALSAEEQALLCSSHQGSDEHVRVAQRIQAKAGLRESDLQCGVHMPEEAAAYRSLLGRGLAPTPNRNNCSGKHSGMLALAKLRGLPLDSYLEIRHPIQQDILTTISEMSGCPRDSIEIGIDGCSAPTFAMPLYNAALAMARLCDPRELRERRQQAARSITSAMISQAEMISGPQEFDCGLMRAVDGKMVSKRGAEGYHAVGIMAGVLSKGSPGVGVALKVSDGDMPFRTIEGHARNRVRPAVMLEILRQIGALGPAEIQRLAVFGPELALRNHRGIITGNSRPVFHLVKES